MTEAEEVRSIEISKSEYELLMDVTHLLRWICIEVTPGEYAVEEFEDKQRELTKLEDRVRDSNINNKLAAKWLAKESDPQALRRPVRDKLLQLVRDLNNKIRREVLWEELEVLREYATERSEPPLNLSKSDVIALGEAIDQIYEGFSEEEEVHRETAIILCLWHLEGMTKDGIKGK